MRAVVVLPFDQTLVPGANTERHGRSHSQYVLATSVPISFKRISAGSLANGQLSRRAHSSTARAAARTRGGNSACVAGLHPRLCGKQGWYGRASHSISTDWPRLAEAGGRHAFGLALLAGRAGGRMGQSLWAAALHMGARLSRSDEISQTCSATMRCAAILAAPGRGSAEPPCLAPCFGADPTSACACACADETRRRPLRSSASAARDEISPAARRAVLSATSPA